MAETLYKATEHGNVPLDPVEEAAIKAEWAVNAAKPAEEKPLSLEQRVTNIEKAIGIK